MRKHSSLTAFGGIIVSTDGWKQGLLHLQQNLREYARAFEQAPAACHAFWSPEPIRQRNWPLGSDFFEPTLLEPYCHRDRWQRSSGTLRCDHKTVEILDMLLPRDQCDIVFDKYRTIAEELVDIIFGSEEQAQRLLGFDDHVISSALWTVVLFRLATQRIEGFGLSPLGARKDEDVYQTLWMLEYEQDETSCRCEPISIDDPPIDNHLLLQECYTGAAWVLSEATGMLHMSSGESSPLDKSIPYTIRFFPSLLLFDPNPPPDDPEKPYVPSLIYYAWTGDDRFQKVSITRPDGSPMDGFGMKRIRALLPLFSPYAELAKRYWCDLPRPSGKNYVRKEVTARFEASAVICEVEREHPHPWITKTSHSISLRMVFETYYQEENDVRLMFWPYEPGSESVSLAESRLPPIQPFEPDRLTMRLIALSMADGFLEEIHNRESFCDDIAESCCYEYLPQQRITNVVQILDNLFEASSKVVTIALAMGRDWIRDNMSRTAPVFTEAWREGEYSIAECRALVARIHESANGSDDQGEEAEDTSKDGGSLQSDSFSEEPVERRRPGRPTSPRRDWIIERYKEGHEAPAIVAEWNKGGSALWMEIDPEDPTPYPTKGKDQKNSVGRVRGIIDRWQKKQGAEQQRD